MESTSRLLVTITLHLLYLFTTSEALYCFKCSDIQHPRFCEHVEQCTEDQICAVKRVIRQATGEVMFSSGCMPSGTCFTNPTRLNGTHPCFTCCSTDLCNIKGCGEHGTVIPQTTGNICFNCEGILRPDDCKTVMFCDQTEICYIEERSHFGELYYRSGCKEKQLCDVNFIATPIIGRRGIQRSTSHLICCNGSLCNNNYHLVPTSSTNDLATRGPFGKHFDIFFPSLFSNNYKMAYMLIVSLAIPYQLTVTLNSENNNQEATVTRTSITRSQYSIYNLSSDVIMTDDGIFPQGVTVHSNESIAVFGIFSNSYYQVSEGFLALPAEYASTEYVIPSFNVSTYRSGSDYAKSVITVNPYYPDTTIHIQVMTKQGPVPINGAPYNNNSTAVVVLNDYDTLQISHTADLTGTLITSTKPIFVVSGNKCNNINNQADCNPFVEMVLPTNQLDSEFVIPVISSHPQSTVRVLATTFANVTFTANGMDITKYLKPREYFDLTHEKISHVKSTGDLLVTLYPHETRYPTSARAYMMTVPGINQYLSEYIFAVPTEFTSYISVTVFKDQIDHFLLDGHALTTVNVVSISHGPDHFSTFSAAISPGMHRITHGGGTAFGLWVYGDVPGRNAYGYPGGLAFRND